MNPSLPPKQPGLQGGNHSSFTQKQYANPKISIPGDMAYLISQSQPARHNNAVSSMRNPANSMSEYADPKISLPDDTLAFLISQSQPVRHNNAVSSMWNPASSMSEVMESGAFALPKRSAVPQDLTVQSSIDFQQLPDSKGYLSLPQNQSYITNINSRQTFSGNAAYNQYPHDLKYNLPLDRNEFHTSRLPSATIRDALGYGNHGSSFHSPGSFLSNSSLGHMRPLSNFNEILPSQYNGGRNFNSVQPHDSFSHWDSNSRSSLFPERTQYNFPGHPDQPSQSQYVGPGYSELNHSQERILEELRQRGGSKNLSSKQLHPFWQHRH
ncbi:hypothetical protein RJT34_00368 [Clitoria ternatea]|uniref:Uncharacterized protein n=1 Tax=Clitoria ternatea TaxID=43366 RepID=A0AAN9KFX6_CLITE